MSISEHNQRIVGRLHESVAAFAADVLDLDQIQAAVQWTAELLENDGSDAATIVRLAEADIEEIRFTRILEDQRPAVIFRLDEMLVALPGGGDA